MMSLDISTKNRRLPETKNKPYVSQEENEALKNSLHRQFLNTIVRIRLVNIIEII